MSRPESKVIVHADDFGETVEITRGICAAIEAGAVTSTTIMATMPGTDDALPRVAALADRASFGVHLNLCEGRPLTQGRTLVNEKGDFHSKRELFLRAVSGALAAADVEAEVGAQIGRIRDGGVRISHVDGHKHLHQLPVVVGAVSRILPRFGIERVRLTRLRRMAAMAQPAKAVRELLALRAAGEFRRAGLRFPSRVADLQAIMTMTNAGAIGDTLREANGIVELFCHPGTAQADVEKPGSCDRNAELQFLLSARYRDMMLQHQVRLATYWEV